MKSYSIKMLIGVGLIIIGGVALWYEEQLTPVAPVSVTSTSTGGGQTQVPVNHPVPTPINTTFQVSIGQVYKVNSTFSVSPLSVTEDSRCPVDVNCIQAGTVTIKVQINDNGQVTSSDLSLGSQNHPMVVVGQHIITMTNVVPVKHAGVVLNPKDYSVTYQIKTYQAPK